MKGKANELLKDTSFFDDRISMKDFGPNALSQFSEYYSMPEKDRTKLLLCAGAEPRQPIFWFDEHRFVATYDLDKDQIDLDLLCDGH